MALFGSLLLFLIFKQHQVGFSHIEFNGAKSVFFLSDNEKMEIYIEGCPTGVSAPGMLYFPENQKEIFVEYKYNGHVFFSKTVALTQTKSLVFGQITPVINLMA